MHHINQALRAHALFKRDVDYVVKDDEVLIVDEFTGRILPGRRYSDGLHQALKQKKMLRLKVKAKRLHLLRFKTISDFIKNLRV